MTELAPLAPFALVVGAALLVLLVADRRQSQTGVWIAKPLASLGFVAAALSFGALSQGAYGVALLVALVLSLAGDVLLIPKGAKGPFLAGLTAFLLGHVAFAVAFVLRGVELRTALFALAPLAVVAALVSRWLYPKLRPSMRAPVLAYIVVISAMLSLATGAVARGAPGILGTGALAFYLSDLAVARQRFVTPSFTNRLVGLPLYYGAQLLLAATLLFP